MDLNKDKAYTVKFCIALILAMLGISAYVDADVRNRYGTIIKSDTAVNGGITTTYQYASDQRLNDELLASVDLVANKDLGNGQITIFIEANTSPRINGIANTLLEANADALTALDRDGRGRIQVSELIYTCTSALRCKSYGLLDPSAYIDISDVANDETSQFLNSTFVNNLSIAFPDYTLGAVVHKDYVGDLPGYTFLLTSSNGLGDNPDRSYSELVDVFAEGKGIFTALELYWRGEPGQLRTGAWLSTADNPALDGSSSNEDNYGLYLVFDKTLSDGMLSGRLGAANETVSEVAYFASLAIEYPIYAMPLGVAIGKSWLSSKINASDTGDRSAAEIYTRFTLLDTLTLSPSIQIIRNSNFDTSGIFYDSRVTVFSLRGNYEF